MLGSVNEAELGNNAMYTLIHNYTKGVELIDGYTHTQTNTHTQTYKDVYNRKVSGSFYFLYM